MSSRLAVLRIATAAVLTLAMAGCSAPLSENWVRYSFAPAPEDSGQAAETPPATDQGTKPEAERTPPNCSKVKCVALTFDDGPGKYTPELLSLLDQYDAKATFFLIGKNVKKHPQIVRDELSKGHEIGNHTWSHKDLTKVSIAAAKRDLQKTDDAIKEATGTDPTLVRPPFGALPRSLKKNLSVPIALWDVDTLDWKTRNTKSTIKAAEKIVPGSIVLMHDIHKSTIDAVPAILKDLSSKGYHFVTVTELIGHPNPGIGYGSGQRPATSKG
ncbi:polysaccharide deacetylase family protein [Paeniglutamicibacter sp. NPDC091659]|uniref:polysaccharide deacetylase family protein n=1 Tax=Paeniglutamicibacter sp. NPDC091659 TaxID=3364389 RepID=UPI00382C9A5E